MCQRKKVREERVGRVGRAEAKKTLHQNIQKVIRSQKVQSLERMGKEKGKGKE